MKFFALIDIALIRKILDLASMAVNKLASLVISTLISFASAGMVESPTMELNGDGAKLGSPNKE